MIDTLQNKKIEVNFSSMKRRYSLISSPIAVLPDVGDISTIPLLEPIDTGMTKSLDDVVSDKDALLKIFKDSPSLTLIEQEDREDGQDEPATKKAKRAEKETVHKKKKKKSNSSNNKYRPYQAEKWQERFEELLEYQKVNGHCLVPHTFPENPPLARWVKRQRYQYKLLQESKQSSMTHQRIKILEDVGFIWDSHEAAWEERLKELLEFKKVTGNCLVPSSFPANPQLATWVKCQRRQYKLYWEGRPSNMTAERIVILEKHQFEWELRTSSPHSRNKNKLKKTAEKVETLLSNSSINKALDFPELTSEDMTPDGMPNDIDVGENAQIFVDLLSDMNADLGIIEDQDDLIFLCQ